MIDHHLTIFFQTSWFGHPKRSNFSWFLQPEDLDIPQASLMCGMEAEFGCLKPIWWLPSIPMSIANSSMFIHHSCTKKTMLKTSNSLLHVRGKDDTKANYPCYSKITAGRWAQVCRDRVIGFNSEKQAKCTWEILMKTKQTFVPSAFRIYACSFTSSVFTILSSAFTTVWP